jgi:hypothetical protein
MINRVFFILDQEMVSDPGLPSPEPNVFYSVAADPAVSGSLQRAYAIMDDTSLPGLALALDLHEPLTPDDIRSIGSFMFLPACLRIGGMPVIILTGDPSMAADLPENAAAALSSWLAGQGFEKHMIHTVLPGEFLRSVEEVDRHFENSSQTGPYFGKTLFFKMPAAVSGSSAPIPVQSVLVSFRSAETALRQRVPQFYALAQAYGELEGKFNFLQRKYDASALELQHQQQYVDTLRSGHAAKEIQDFYTREYEILPLWYKRFGQVLKVLTGKRTFRSLFRDNTKKYKV